MNVTVYVNLMKGAPRLFYAGVLFPSEEEAFKAICQEPNEHYVGTFPLQVPLEVLQD